MTLRIFDTDEQQHIPQSVIYDHGMLLHSSLLGKQEGIPTVLHSIASEMKYLYVLQKKKTSNGYTLSNCILVFLRTSLPRCQASCIDSNSNHREISEMAMAACFFPE